MTGFQIQTQNVNTALLDILKLVRDEGEWVEVRKGDDTVRFKEVRGVNIVIQNPTERVLYHAERGNDLTATAAETLWVLAGNNDMNYLSKFLPRAPDYSDDGIIWRAGYGQRLRHAGSDGDNVDQLQFIYDMLTITPNSRQAVMNIWDCVEENHAFYHGGTKDYPCNDLQQFIVRNGQLELYNYVRSNDAIFGATGINFYEFSVIQALMAGALGLDVGSYNHHVCSLHYYDWHKDKVDAILDNEDAIRDSLNFYDTYSLKGTSFKPLSVIPEDSVTWGDITWDEIVKWVDKAEMYIRGYLGISGQKETLNLPVYHPYLFTVQVLAISKIEAKKKGCKVKDVIQDVWQLLRGTIHEQDSVPKEIVVNDHTVRYLV